MVYGEAILELRGVEYPLLYSGRAMWALKKRLKGRDLMEVLPCRTLADFYLAWECGGVLSRCHKAASRGLGEEPGPLLDPECWTRAATPEETVELVGAVAQAVKLGLTREHRKGEFDKALAELRRKQGKGLSYAQYIRYGVVSGFSPAQTLDLTPGVLFDLWELYLDATGRRKKEE